MDKNKQIIFLSSRLDTSWKFWQNIRSTPMKWTSILWNSYMLISKKKREQHYAPLKYSALYVKSWDYKGIVFTLSVCSAAKGAADKGALQQYGEAAKGCDSNSRRATHLLLQRPIGSASFCRRTLLSPTTLRGTTRTQQFLECVASLWFIFFLELSLKGRVTDAFTQWKKG